MHKNKTVLIKNIIIISAIIAAFAVLFFLLNYPSSWHNRSFNDKNCPESFFPDNYEITGVADPVEGKHIKSLGYDIYYLELSFTNQEYYKDFETSYLSDHKLLHYTVTKLRGGGKAINYEHNDLFNYYPDFQDGTSVNGSETIRIIDLSGNKDYDNRYLSAWICNDDSNEMTFMYVRYDDSTSVSAKSIVRDVLKIIDQQDT